ncbi:MAG: glycosyl transferase, partial [Bacteroidota bacterium]
MRILYAIQGTGNGHLARAEEIIPILFSYGKVDLFVSGS